MSITRSQKYYTLFKILIVQFYLYNEILNVQVRDTSSFVTLYYKLQLRQ